MCGTNQVNTYVLYCIFICAVNRNNIFCSIACAHEMTTDDQKTRWTQKVW